MVLIVMQANPLLHHEGHFMPRRFSHDSLPALTGRLVCTTVCSVATVILICMDIFNMAIGVFIVGQVPVFGSRVYYNVFIAVFLLNSFVTTGSQNATFSFFNINSARIKIQSYNMYLPYKIVSI